MLDPETSLLIKKLSELLLGFRYHKNKTKLILLKESEKTWNYFYNIFYSSLH